MTAIRTLVARRHLAMLICAAALAMKLLVPTGYMPGGGDGRFTVVICSGTQPRAMSMEMPGAMPGMPGHGTPKDHKAELPCAFAGLSAAVIAAIDPVQLAALIAFVMAVGLARSTAPPPAARRHLRPPLRGPPAYL